jgi:hypothetical protein
MRTRIQGLPIATSIQTAAFTTLGAKIGDTTVGQTNVFSIGDFHLAVFQLIVGAGLAYLILVLLLDILHYMLLIKAANHTKYIETQYFKDKLSITTKLTASHYTHLYLGLSDLRIYLYIRDSFCIIRLPKTLIVLCFQLRLRPTEKVIQIV